MGADMPKTAFVRVQLRSKNHVASFLIFEKRLHERNGSDVELKQRLSKGVLEASFASIDELNDQAYVLVSVVGGNSSMRRLSANVVPFFQIVSRVVLERGKGLLWIFAKELGRLDDP